MRILLLIVFALIELAEVALYLFLSYKLWRRYSMSKALWAQVGLSVAAYLLHGILLLPVLLYVGFDAPNASYIGSFSRENLEYIASLDFTNLSNYIPELKRNGVVFVILELTGKIGLFFLLSLLMAPFARRKSRAAVSNVQ